MQGQAAVLADGSRTGAVHAGLFLPITWVHGVVLLARLLGMSGPISQARAHKREVAGAAAAQIEDDTKRLKGPTPTCVAQDYPCFSVLALIGCPCAGNLLVGRCGQYRPVFG